MSDSRFPLPPQGEFDDDGRHVHPYVRDPEPDASAPGYTTDGGDQFTQEDRSRESRVAFHVIEGFLQHLTPLGMAYLMQCLVHRLYSPALAEEMAEQGTSADELDPRDELVAFEELHTSALKGIHREVERIVDTCPNCGRRHTQGCTESLQPGAYVNAATGDSVSVRRVADAKVYAVAQVDASGRKVSRLYERDWFERHFVPADDIAVLGEGGSV